MAEHELSACSDLGSDAGSSGSNRVKSDVWAFFDKSGLKTVKCKLCNNNYAYHGGTTRIHYLVLFIPQPGV